MLTPTAPLDFYGPGVFPYEGVYLALIPVFHPSWEFAAKRGITITSRPERRFNALMIRPE